MCVQEWAMHRGWLLLGVARLSYGDLVMRRVSIVGVLVVACVALVWFTRGQEPEHESDQAPAVLAQDGSSSATPAVGRTPDRARPVRRLRRFQPPPNIPPERIGGADVMTTNALSDHDFAAFKVIMRGMKENRAAIEHCVYDLENTATEPTVYKWSLDLDVATIDGSARIRDVASDTWPAHMPEVARECFAAAISGTEFDAGGELFSYRVRFDMAIAVAPPPSSGGT